MICKKNHSHLPVLLKSSFLVFFLFFFLFSLNTKCLAQIAPHCISYFTCHYQSGTGLNCPQGTQPFHACYCWVDSAGCRKVQNDFCTTQDWCDFLIRYASLCREYGDCCGCSGKPKPIPSPTPTPRPVPTPTPLASCYQPCRTDSDCSNGLKCGYHVSVGKRVCLNPACAGEQDCRCSWQR